MVEFFLKKYKKGIVTYNCLHNSGYEGNEFTISVNLENKGITETSKEAEEVYIKEAFDKIMNIYKGTRSSKHCIACYAITPYD